MREAEVISKRISRRHECTEIKRHQASEYYRVEIIEIDTRWFLNYKTFATEADVRLDEAEYVGDQTYGLEISISFCPMCGLRLSSEEK